MYCNEMNTCIVGGVSGEKSIIEYYSVMQRIIDRMCSTERYDRTRK